MKGGKRFIKNNNTEIERNENLDNCKIMNDIEKNLNKNEDVIPIYQVCGYDKPGKYYHPNSLTKVKNISKNRIMKIQIHSNHSNITCI